MKAKKKLFITLLISAVLLLASILGELYLFIKAADNYFAIIGDGILVLVFLFSTVLCLGMMWGDYENERKKQFDEYMKSQKLIYLSNKKAVDDLLDRMDEMAENFDEAMEHMEAVSKSVGKTIIKKNMENSIDIRQAIRENKVEFPEIHFPEMPVKENDDAYNVAFDVEVIKRSMLDAISHAEEQIVDAIKNIDFVMPAAEILSSSKYEEEDSIIEEPVVEEQGAEESVAEEPVAEESVAEEPVVEEPVVEEAEELPPMPDLSDPNKQMSADEIAALFANMS